MAATTIPALPCADLDSSLEFWQQLGYAVTYVQRRPNPYAVIADADYALHLFGLSGLEPAANFSTCLIILDDLAAQHARFTQQLRAGLGRIPQRGIPRISRLRPGQSRFTLTDVAGNSVIFIQRNSTDSADAPEQDLGPLEKALATAARLRDFKGDDAAAARVLDTALKRYPADGSAAYAQVVADRLELAEVLGETELSAALRAQLAD